jgi:F420-non-reducing hydrogenase small subunit
MILDREKCYLAQGIVCMGPITRGGCESRCIKGGMACTGCFGPMDNIADYGAKAVSTYASVISSKEEPAIEKALEGIADPGGTFYRYSLPKSLLVRNPKKR